MSHDNWERVSRKNSCPICGGPDNCSISTDGGAAWCGRIDAGSIRQNAGGQWLHILKDGNRTHAYEHPSHRRGRDWSLKSNPQPKPMVNWSGLMQFCVDRPDISEKREILARQLGVSVAALDRLHVGWSGKENAWMIPERDPSGRIIGVVRRFRVPRLLNGKLTNKQQMRYASRGLTYATDWLDDSGPILLVEGASDVAALLTAGISTVGRPSNSGGVDLLCEMLHRLPFDREVIVVGENDRKPHHDLNPSIQARHKPDCQGCLKCWPGYAAFNVAKQLAQALQRPVGVAFPPDDAKDVRDLLRKLEGVS